MQGLIKSKEQVEHHNDELKANIHSLTKGMEELRLASQFEHQDISQLLKQVASSWLVVSSVC